jgi:hypothetical protein
VDVLHGSCHCSALHVELVVTKPPAELPVRRCGCQFCLRHRPRYTSDPLGRATVRMHHATSASRYRFGLQLADFLVCATCGVFVGAADAERAVFNIEALDRRVDFTAAPLDLTIYDSEDVAARTARRAKGWMPVDVVIRAT